MPDEDIDALELAAAEALLAALTAQIEAATAELRAFTARLLAQQRERAEQAEIAELDRWYAA